MARTAKNKDDEVKELHKPDCDYARRLFMDEIKPAQARIGEFAQEMSTAYKELKKSAHVHPGAAKTVFKLVEMDFDKQQEWLRSFKGMCVVMNIGLERDLFDQEDDDDTSHEFDATASDVVPSTAPRKAEPLVTLEVVH
jgi:hypothetical protein